METISGKPNKFTFIGIYNPNEESFEIKTPEEVEEIYFEVDDDGTAYIFTKLMFEYDPDTGCLYLIEEVD